MCYMCSILGKNLKKITDCILYIVSSYFSWQIPAMFRHCTINSAALGLQWHCNILCISSVPIHRWKVDS